MALISIIDFQIYCQFLHFRWFCHAKWTPFPTPLLLGIQLRQHHHHHCNQHHSCPPTCLYYLVSKLTSYFVNSLANIITIIAKSIAIIATITIIAIIMFVVSVNITNTVLRYNQRGMLVADKYPASSNATHHSLRSILIENSHML